MGVQSNSALTLEPDRVDVGAGSEADLGDKPFRARFADSQRVHRRLAQEEQETLISEYLPLAQMMAVDMVSRLSSDVDPMMLEELIQEALQNAVTTYSRTGNVSFRTVLYYFLNRGIGQRLRRDVVPVRRRLARSIQSALHSLQQGLLRRLNPLYVEVVDCARGALPLSWKLESDKIAVGSTLDAMPEAASYGLRGEGDGLSPRKANPGGLNPALATRVERTSSFPLQ